MLASASSVNELNTPFGVHPNPIPKAPSDLARLEAEISQESRGFKKVQFAALPDKHFAPITSNKRRELNEKRTDRKREKNPTNNMSSTNGGYNESNGNGHLSLHSSAETLISNSSGEGSPPRNNGGSPPRGPGPRNGPEPEPTLRELLNVLTALSRDVQEVLRRLPPPTPAQPEVATNSTSPQQ